MKTNFDYLPKMKKGETRKVWFLKGFLEIQTTCPSPLDGPAIYICGILVAALPLWRTLLLR